MSPRISRVPAKSSPRIQSVTPMRRTRSAPAGIRPLSSRDSDGIGADRLQRPAARIAHVETRDSVGRVDRLVDGRAEQQRRLAEAEAFERADRMAIAESERDEAGSQLVVDGVAGDR